MDSTSDIPVTDVITEDMLGLVDHDANLSSFNVDSDNDDPFSIDDMLFADTTNMLETVNYYSPLVASMKFFGDMPSAPIPNASINFPHIIKKAPFRTDNALGVIDPDGVVPTFSVVGRICEGNTFSHKVGPYLDMAPFNGEVSIDTFRRAKLRTLLTHVSTVASPPYNAAEMSIVAKAKTKFERLAGFLQIVFGTYLDQAQERDHTLYPAGVDNNGWVRQSGGDHCLPIVSSPVFGNVPRGSAATASVAPSDLHRHPAFSTFCPNSCVVKEEMRRKCEQRNLAAFAVDSLPEDVDLSEIRLGHFPDPESYYLKLARAHNLSGVKILIPEYYDAQGLLVHPIRYKDTFKVGTMVAVDIQPYMWDMTYSRRDVNIPVDRPARHASMHIIKMRVLPTEVEDFRLLIHQYAVHILRQRQEQKEASEVAEQHRARSLALATEKLASEKKRKESQQLVARQRLQELQAALATNPNPLVLDPTSSSAGSQSKKRTLEVSSSDRSSHSPSEAHVEGPPVKTARITGGRKQPKRNAPNAPPMSARQMEKQREIPDAEPMDEDCWDGSSKSFQRFFKVIRTYSPLCNP
ncbi:hypothetical protein EV360DRAFT_67154 [Lentinula raphanica]|nr:hypothetical protein EV360DRAFT_67154 [Lentinula raphanica]